MSNGIAHFLFKKIIDRAVEELKLDEEKFDTFINGSLDTHLYYDGADIQSWKDLENIDESIRNKTLEGSSAPD